LLGDPGGLQFDYCGSTFADDDNSDCEVSSTSVDFSQTNVKQVIDDLNAEPDPLSANQELVSSNYMSVSINYDIIRYEVLTESKAMTFSQLLGAIGGSMGLFLGISLISVLEVVADLGILRLIPRLWGDRRLNGVGSI
jgi:hypothetical protein